MDSTMANILKDLTRLQRENHEHRPFIAWRELKQLMTRERVATILEASQVQFNNLEQTTRAVLKDGIRVFAILVRTGEVEMIERFIEADHYRGLLDARLPLSSETLKTVELSGETRDSFYREQWTFVAPVFEPDQAHRRLDDHIITPFLTSEPLGAGATGAFAEMSKVVVDDKHHHIPHTGTKLSLVCKRVTRQSKGRTLEETFRHEHYILSCLRCLKHPNIINLITAYTKGETFNLLFPAADGDLHQILAGSDRPPGLKDDSDIVGALWGLSSAIEALHGFFAKDFGVRKIGLHYDIKPRNILYHDNRLILSDFGLSNLRDHEDGSESLFQVGEGDFLAPECEPADQGFNEGPIGRASDIWSFGCVLATVLAYLQEGADGVAKFKQDRRVQLAMKVESVFHNGTEPNPGVERFLRTVASPNNGGQSFLPLALVTQDILRIAPQERPRAGTITSCLFHFAQHQVFATIPSTLKIHIDTMDLEFEIELRRLMIWGGAVGLLSESQALEEWMWLASSHPYEDFHLIQDCLGRCEKEVRVIVSDMGRKDSFTSNRYYNLQRLVDCLWNTQPASVHSKMMSELEKDLLATDDASRLEEIQEAFEPSNSNFRSNQSPMPDDLELTPTNLALRRIGLLALMKSISLALAEGRSFGRELMIDPTAVVSVAKFHNHFLGRHGDDGPNVLVEKLTYSASWRLRVDELVGRVHGIASLRTQVADGIFPILQCRGFYHDTSRREFGLVYELPNSFSDRHPMNLVQVMENGNSRTNKPSLTEKFDLASILVSTVFGIHKAGWLHKNICSFNIICFPKETAKPSPSITTPYIVGFNYSRSNKETAYTDGPETGVKGDLRNYQHPVYIRNSRSATEESENPRKRFREEFEYYSVGLVLLEIALWTPLSRIIKSIGGSPEDVRKQLLRSHIALVKTYMGDAYAGAVKACLEAYSGEDTPVEESRNAFGKSVVTPISERKV
ncbi:MAG: hypothetical protein Q9224_002498 [Gallowayella concinna]